MSQIASCRRCGTTLGPYAPEGMCPNCMLGSALADEPEVSGEEDRAGTDESAALFNFAGKQLGRFGDYELLELIGHGGMGVVYKGRQDSLRRIVALKMLLLGGFSSPEIVQRFRREAQTAAILQHPNIVAIHEVGEIEGQPFYSMDHVEGQSLAQILRENPLPARQAASYAKAIAEAIHFAHGRGILHRDLKPSNILIDAATDQVRITDFGLAKRMDQDSSLTLTGQTIGSPNYLPPEQAAGRHDEIGPASDVYSIGAILYELLTGRPPFLAQSLQDTLIQIRDAEPAAPRLLNPAIPRDLETICLKSLQKEPKRRYQTARDLADELQRFICGEPIRARPVSQPEKLWRWSRRNPSLAGVSVSLIFVVALVIAGVFWQLQRAKAESEQDRQRLVRLNVAAGVRLMDEGDLIGALPWFAHALKLDRGNPDLEEIHRLRIGTLMKQCPRLLALMPHQGAVQDAKFSRDGRWIVSGSRDGTARVWDAITGEPVTPSLQHGSEVVRVDLSPDGQRVLTAGGKQVRLWDALTGESLLSPFEHEYSVLHAAFSPDGAHVVSVCSVRFEPGQVHLWDISTGKPVLPSLKLDQPGQHAVFSPKGRLVAIATGHVGAPGCIQLWDMTSGETLKVAIEPRLPIWRVAFTPDSRFILAAGGNWQWSGAALLWDTHLQQQAIPSMKHSAQVNVAAFSADATRVVTASLDNTARVWDAATADPITPPLQHQAWVLHAAFSPDGQFVVTTSLDKTVRIWRADTGEPVGPPLLHPAGVLLAEFSPDGLRLLTASEDRLLRVWDTVTIPPAAKPLPTGSSRTARCIAFSPRGGLLASGADGGTCRLWDIETGNLLRQFKHHTGSIHSLTFSPDGRLLLVTSGDGTATLVDPLTGRLTTPPLQHSNWVWRGAFSSDGLRAATPSADRTVRIWSTTDGKPLVPPLRHPGTVFEAEFSLDGRYLLTLVRIQGSMDSIQGMLYLWDSFTGASLPHRITHQGQLARGSYSPDGRRLITGSFDQTARIWDVNTWTPLTPPLAHNGVVNVVCFSPDGRRVLTGSRDNTARIWDASTGQPLTPPMNHSHEIFDAEFSRDGRLVITTSRDATARVWDAATGEPITQPLRHRAKTSEHFGAFSPDRRWVATVGADPYVRLWELTGIGRVIEDLVSHAELLAASTASDTGDFVPLPSEKLYSIWKELRAKHPADFRISDEQALAWHRHQADANEQAQHWFAAAFHLERLLAADPADPTLIQRKENKIRAPQSDAP